MKNFILSALIIIGLASCGKKDSGSTTPTPTQKSYLKMKVDGVMVELNGGGMGATMMADIEQMGIGFTNGNTSALQSASAVLDDVDVATPKTYVMKKNGYNNFTFIKSHADKDNNTYLVFDNFGHTGEMTIVVTKIKAFTANDKAINGTFSGKLYNKNGGMIIITEGEFFDVRTQ